MSALDEIHQQIIGTSYALWECAANDLSLDSIEHLARDILRYCSHKRGLEYVEGCAGCVHTKSETRDEPCWSCFGDDGKRNNWQASL